MNAPVKKRVRCAVYTRKSSDEGLDQDYNSIDAQRDAGQAYIASQRHEGWIPVSDDYDDPAFSGGNLERPALKRLLADIHKGLIDVVVIYKIDRLTRSLTDFSKIVDVFEAKGVSFVSVTQQFNTTTSMGRLMLNILLSFAQFEREVTGERIRDKIAASKKKGMWMGGRPPLGYDVVARKLVINEAEAATVRRIFQRFVEIGSSAKLIRELRMDGVTGKSWTTQEGKWRQGTLLDKGGLYKLFHNRAYLGEISLKGQWFPAEHKAIIDRPLWDGVHAILSSNRNERSGMTRRKVPFPLKGLVVDRDGRALTTNFARNRFGRLYRYYLPIREVKEGPGASGLPRIPAAELEAAVFEQLRGVLRAPGMTAQIVARATKLDPTLDEAKVVVGMTRLESIWDQLFPPEQTRLVRLLVEKVIVSPDNIEVRLRPNGIEEVVLDLQPEGEAEEVTA